MSRYHAKVFAKDGNRFLIPGVWYDAADENVSSTGILCDALMFEIVLKAKSETDWLDVTTNDNGTADITHVPYLIVGSQFAHGGMDILLIGGPLFDAALATPETPDEQ